MHFFSRQQYLTGCLPSGGRAWCTPKLRKNDTQSKGHFLAPDCLRGPGQELDVVQLHCCIVQLHGWIELAGLAVPVHQKCAKQSLQAVVCELCQQLFPLTRCAKGCTTVAGAGSASAKHSAEGERLDQLGGGAVGGLQLLGDLG
jgi:hypothetical protein